MFIRKEGKRTCRKGGKRLEQKVKERKRRRRDKRIDEEEEGVIYKVNCMDCSKFYIGETKFGIRKRMK